MSQTSQSERLEETSVKNSLKQIIPLDSSLPKHPSLNSQLGGTGTHRNFDVGESFGGKKDFGSISAFFLLCEGRPVISASPS
jgi:hypothetical protein